MIRLPPILRDERLYPLWVALVAAAILFVRLGSYGFWEPAEIQVADRANDIAGTASAASPDLTPSSAESIPVEGVKPKATAKHRQTRSELDAELVAMAIERAGRGEASSRFPIAVLAWVTLIAIFFIGFRVAGSRAGLISATVAVAFPALLMGGRHLNSEIGAVAGSALVVLGLLGLALRKGFGIRSAESKYVLYPIDIALIAFGAYLSYRGAGALLGLIPPFAAVGFAAALSIAGKKSAGEKLHLGLAALAGIAVSGVALAVFFGSVFDVVDPPEMPAQVEGAAKPIPSKTTTSDDTGYALLGGKDLKSETGYVEALAGIWRKTGDRRVGFSSTLEDIAIGTFPWIAVIPIAVLVLLIGRGTRDESEESTSRSGTAETARLAIGLWALFAYVSGAIFARKVGAAMYPAWGALAIACGVWLTDVFSAPRQANQASQDDENSRTALPLAAFFVVCAAVVIGKDILAFPEKLIGLNLKGAKLEFPPGIKVQLIWIVLGWSAALCLAAALATRGVKDEATPGRIGRVLNSIRRVVQKGGLSAALILGVVSAICFAQVLTPALSKKLSSKNILGVYQELRAEGDLLGIMGQAGGASYYAGTDFERIRGRSKLLAFLEKDERVFALAPASERCPLNKAARKKSLPYYVVDDSSSQYLLFSNKLKDGEIDVNPLAKTFFSAPPEGIRKELSWNFDDRIELIGVSMPDSVRKGSTFTVKLYFKVLKPISRNWKIFLHFDAGARFNGDHDPIGGTCGTQYWLPGDYVVDEFELQAGSRTLPTGAYQVWTGLFVGSSGNFTNMKVVTEGADKHNRIPLGTLKLK